jgi:hypothetical protein
MYNEHTSPLIRKKNSMKALNIQRVNENHYISWYETDDLNNISSTMSKLKLGGTRYKHSKIKLVRNLNVCGSKNKTRKYSKKNAKFNRR